MPDTLDMTQLHLNSYLSELKKLVLNYIAQRPIKVYLFGSRAAGTARRTSDVDIALWPMEAIPSHFFSDLRELVEESTIPYTVDIIDLSQTDPGFRQKIIEKGIIWKE
jgi:uncharacterized protein